MFEKRIHVESGRRLTLVEMAHDTAVSGWDEADVLLRLEDGTEQDLSVQETEAGPSVTARRPCEVYLPAALPLAVREALGNLRVKEIDQLAAEQVRGSLKVKEVREDVVAEVYGHLRAKEVTTLRVMGTVYGEAALSEVGTADLQNVRGILSAKETGQLRVSRVGGNLVAKEIAGTFDAGQIGGDAILKEIGGAVTLDQVAGSLTAKALTGGATAAKIGGSLLLGGDLGTGVTYRFKAGGNALLRLDQDSCAHLTLVAGGKIHTSLPLTGEQRTEQTLSGSLGSGGPEIAVEAGGNILVGSGQAEPGPELGEEISRHVQESLRALDLEGIGRRVSDEAEAAMSRLRVKMEGMDWEHLGRGAQQSMERAMERMQRDAERVQRGAERFAEQAARQQDWVARAAEREARRQERWARRASAAAFYPSESDEPGEPAEASASEPEPDRDQERLTILKMVEQGQIRPEEAEMLLDALE